MIRMKAIYSTFLDFRNWFFMRFLWGMSEKNYYRTVELFAATEADTVWQLVYGIDKIHDPNFRAQVFTQIVEEDFHAETFYKISRARPEAIYRVPPQEKEFLYSDDDPVWKLLAYCYVGEEEAARQFESIARVTPVPELKKALDKIVEDEAGHVVKAYRLLKGLGATDGQIRWELIKIRFKRRIQTMQRSLKKLFEYLIDGMLSVIYFFFGPLLSLYARKKMEGR